MKKLISLIIIATLSAVVLGVSAYAEELEEAQELPELAENILPPTVTISSEIIMSDIAEMPTLPPLQIDNLTGEKVIENSENIEKSDGVFEVPIRAGNGSGTLVEDAIDTEINRQFITVRSRGGNIFYIIIDKDGKSEDVYFLNAVGDFDLLSFLENFPDGVVEAYDELKEEAARLEAERVILENQDESEGIETKKNADDSDDLENVNEKPDVDFKKYISVGIGVLFLGGLFYFRLLSPKEAAVNQVQMTMIMRLKMTRTKSRRWKTNSQINYLRERERRKCLRSGAWCDFQKGWLF